MTDPVTNVEIEDVLSSIRRLVAEGDRKRAPLIASEHNPAAPTSQPERFVLTPAFRVADAEEPAPEPQVADESLELAAQFVAPTSEPLELTPTMSEPLVHDAMSMIERASLEATIAELEAAVSDQTEEWEPDGSEVSRSSGIDAAFADLADAPVIEHDDIEEVPEAGLADVVMLHDPVVTPSQPAPVAPKLTQDDADADYGDELQAADDDGLPIPDDLDESIATYLATGGGAIDQDALRAMVQEVVRQELQGEMGKRITRNVRKLVRREINAELSSKSFT